MASTRFKVAKQKASFYLGEIRALREGGLLYLAGFGILLTLLLPFLFVELVILLASGKNMGWFQDTQHEDNRVPLKTGDVPCAFQNPANRELNPGYFTEGDLFLENYAGQTVDELIGLQRTHRIDSIVLAFESALEVRRENGEPLTSTELTILAIEGLEREVNNGGFSQFFFNSTVEYAPVIVASLKNVGCPEIARLAQTAIDNLNINSLDINAITERINMNDRKLEEALDTLNDLYYECEEPLCYSLFEFIKSKRGNINLIRDS